VHHHSSGGATVEGYGPAKNSKKENRDKLLANLWARANLVSTNDYTLVTDENCKQYRNSMSPAIPGMILGGTPSSFSTTPESYIAKSQPFGEGGGNVVDDLRRTP